MNLSKEVILRKTHYGLQIYAHVLRQYYPGSIVLSLSGRDCQPALNPFNSGKPTLHISIENDCAVHYDRELKECKGDAFDFAGLHYGITDEALYKKLDEEMYLRIGAVIRCNGIENVKEQPAKSGTNKALVPVFSYFRAPVTNTIPSGQINIVTVYEWIRSDKYASQTTTLRTKSGKKEAKDYKASHFDYVTFSGLFSRRMDNALQKHSGLLTIDLDHIGSPDNWISRLLLDEYFETELLFASPSGDGLKWIVPIDLTRATHLNYFKSISNYVWLTYGLKMDSSGSDISRACFLPYDPNIYINPKYIS
jgi:hypothetical protein